MTGRFLYRCIICLTRLVNSFLCLLLDLVRAGPVDFLPADFGSAGPVGFAPAGSAGPVGPGPDAGLSGKHVEDCGKLVVLGAFSMATF